MYGLSEESCDRLVMSAMGEAMEDHSRHATHFTFLSYSGQRKRAPEKRVKEKCNLVPWKPPDLLELVREKENSSHCLQLDPREFIKCSTHAENSFLLRRTVSSA